MTEGMRRLVWGLLFLTACGYGIRRRDVVLGEGGGARVQRVFVPVVDNLSLKTGIESQITTTLRETLSGIKGIELVGSADEAQFLLLASITSLDRGVESVVTGTPSTQAEGGLANNQVSAGQIKVVLGMNARLVEKAGSDGKLRRQLWSRDFLRDGVYETSRRFSDISGSSSTPQINESRELVQIRVLAEAISQQILDQVVQDF